MKFKVCEATRGTFHRSDRLVCSVEYRWLSSLAGLVWLVDIAASGVIGNVPLTATAHWGRRRPDLIQMVPPVFSRPDLLVTITGILEMLGAVGLMLSSVAPYSALGLTLLLVAVFPANVHAARKRLTIAGRQVEALIPRTLLQFVFLAATVAVFVGA
jgi:uncharacterized membrane protein